uniref:Claudin-34 n=1 Tax=Camelus bactrianus TaxID=9837 RepID=A0A9W3GP92_CAMBA|nr:claudin-34 [Camelus bactrianus]
MDPGHRGRGPGGVSSAVQRHCRALPAGPARPAWGCGEPASSTTSTMPARPPRVTTTPPGTHLPLHIRIAQSLLMASILGLLGKAFIIFALRNVYLGIAWTRAACNPFTASGTLNVAASLCISMTVVWNYRSVMNEEEVAFLPPLNVPFKPDTQQTGGDILLRVWLPSRCL